MCGIAAIHGAASAHAGARMLVRLEHRGPDDDGCVTLPGAWLGHRRLSIVDVEGGHQPLVNPSGDLWLVGNGEVYNHEALRRELDESLFATSSDNEVALHLVDQRGPDALAELTGMFAFLLAGDDGRFVAARDPVGIKPLYWVREPGRTTFASEIAAFDRDLREEVEAFPPGCYWTPDTGLVQFASPVPATVNGDRPRSPEPPAELLERTREVLVDSVRRQLMGDVPVGVFLSGGLDSSLVAAIAQRVLRERGETLKTFAVGIDDAADLVAARAVADHLETEHHEWVYSQDEAQRALPEVVRVIEAFDASLVRSAVPNLMLARFTSEHVKVVLTGEGADELFAGYEYLREFTDPEELHDELVRMIEGLHNLNLQRCDRVTMAHGLEARVPFLDREVIDFALAIPAEWKLSSAGRPEKELLRRAFEGWLPHEFLWREKAQFGDGSGAASALSEPLADTVSEEELRRERAAVTPPLRTREELAYFRIFRRHLGPVRPEQTLGRFATA